MYSRRMALKKEVARSGRRELLGLVLTAVSVLMLLSMISYDAGDIGLIRTPRNDPLLNFIGPAGAWFAFISFMAFGVAGYLLPVVAAVLGLLLLLRRHEGVRAQALALGAVMLGVICMTELQPDLWAAVIGRLNIPVPGGMLGYLVGDGLLRKYIGDVGTAIVCAGLIIGGLVVLFDVAPLALLVRGAELMGAATGLVRGWVARRRDRREEIEREERRLERERRRLERSMRRDEAREAALLRARRRVVEGPVEKSPAPVKEEEHPEEKVKVSRRRPRSARNRAKGMRFKSEVPPVPGGVFRTPPLDILDEPPEGAGGRLVKGDVQAGARILKETLAEFGIEADVTNVERGPVVTRYEVLPAPGVRVERIGTLSNNLALAMKAESIRIQAPVPGKGVVGVEVPNPKTSLVYLREILESRRWAESGALLPLAIGKDVSGKEIVADLTEMPHLLVAGATGSGKTVCMNSLIAGLLMSRTPDQMRLMLIDPKIVEFSSYNGLPHLIVPVITDARKVVFGLRWAINEMEKRYKLFARVGVRNIHSYNRRPLMKQEELFDSGAEGDSEEKIPDRLPYIVIVVDELADLMLVAQSDIENAIARLAQLSRAVGIHMIIATQRPSVNVITGTIKANFPARIAFQVAQKVDSRTILDANGADKLLGKGDMLFLPPGTSKLVRAQGTLTSEEELRRVIEFYRQQGAPNYEASIKQKLESRGAPMEEGEDEELIERALEVIRQTRRASTSSLQRRLRIGYTRAARIMDILEQRGVVGPQHGSDPREILVDLDASIPQNERAMEKDED